MTPEDLAKIRTEVAVTDIQWINQRCADTVATREYLRHCQALLRYISQQAAELDDLKLLLQRVRSAAISGMNAAHEISRHELATAKWLRAESKPEVVDSERSANALLTDENDKLREALRWALENDTMGYINDVGTAIIVTGNEEKPPDHLRPILLAAVGSES